MNVCIDIYSLNNRGDWLMFEAALEQVRKRFPNARVSVPERAFVRNREFFLSKGIVAQVDRMTVRSLVRKLLQSVRRRRLSHLRYMRSSSVDLLLFAPGFRFSDQFDMTDERKIDEEIAHFRSFTKKGRRVVFLPQAFGPFERESEKRRVRESCRIADRIYARESVSYQYLTKVLPNADKVSIAPDFTCLYHGENHSIPYERKDYVVVIPNRQMIVRSKYPSEYCNFMMGLVRLLVARKENVVLLNHEGTSDVGLIEVLNAAIGNQGVVVSDVSGGACKSVIAGAKLVVTSRFHGLVSALTESVPTLCTSWSHKYQELVSQLGCPSSCLNIENPHEALNVVKAALDRPSPFVANPDRLSAMRGAVEAMWEEVFSCI